jgi:type IV fimbrial biogenesis protein FimT
MQNQIRGVTLIELMVVIAILAILTTLAVPSFDSWRNSSRLSSYSNLLATSLNYAKSEAVSRGVRVTLCRSAAPEATPPSCTAGSNWNTGWIVFVDNTHISGNVAGTLDGADVLLKQVSSTLGANMNADDNFNGWVSFLPSGMSRGSGGAGNGNFALCLTSVTAGMDVAVNVVGRVTLAKRVCS